MAGKFFLYVNQSLDATSDKISSFSKECLKEENTRTHRGVSTKSQVRELADNYYYHKKDLETEH